MGTDLRVCMSIVLLSRLLFGDEPGTQRRYIIWYFKASRANLLYPVSSYFGMGVLCICGCFFVLREYTQVHDFMKYLIYEMVLRLIRLFWWECDI